MRPKETLLPGVREALEQGVEAMGGEMPDRERDVLARRFGLWDTERQTFRALGQAYGLSVERMRQIEAKALRRLRANHLGPPGYDREWIERRAL